MPISYRVRYKRRPYYWHLENQDLGFFIGRVTLVAEKRKTNNNIKDITYSKNTCLKNTMRFCFTSQTVQ